jgi:large subunit ribosomal protein L6
MPIQLPQGVTLTLKPDNSVTVKGPKGELSQAIDPDIKVEISNGEVVLTRPTEQKRHKSLHGLYRSLINNMVHGVSDGYKIEMEVVGVGYKAEAKGQVLEMSLGYSHDIHFLIPDEVKVEARTERRSNPVITLSSSDKQLIGQVAAKIRSFRAPEPYKGKGIKFVGEELRKKAGKSATAK